MAEFIASAVQTVAANQNILFTDTIIEGSKCIVHRSGSGLVTLRGLTNNSSARFLVEYGGNLTNTSAGAVSLAIAINGESLASSTMIVTPSTVGDYHNISSSTYIVVPKGCCVTVSVENTSSQTVSVQNSNLIVTRVA